MHAHDLSILNIAAYKFVDLEPRSLTSLREQFLQTCRSLKIKGTILLSQEGINLFLAGQKEDILRFWQFLIEQTPFAGMTYKSSWSKSRPFKRMVVKIKPEVITLARADVRPSAFNAKRISAGELQSWLREKRELILLDTRNDFEVALGTFENARHLNIESFRDFPVALDKLEPQLKSKPVVIFCTGGIRCEKAAPLMETLGFSQVYQLEGGIVKYFEETGGSHFRGECFVFDDRVALDGSLQETGAVLCERCQMPVTQAQQQSDEFKAGKYCPYCKTQNGEPGKRPRNTPASPG